MSDLDTFLRMMDEAKLNRARYSVSPTALPADVAASIGLSVGERITAAPVSAAPDRGSGGYAEHTIILLRRSIAASLAGGMIAASGRPHTAAEAVAVLEEVMTTLYPPMPPPGS